MPLGMFGYAKQYYRPFLMIRTWLADGNQLMSAKYRITDDAANVAHWKKRVDWWRLYMLILEHRIFA